MYNLSGFFIVVKVKFFIGKGDSMERCGNINSSIILIYLSDCKIYREKSIGMRFNFFFNGIVMKIY